MLTPLMSRWVAKLCRSVCSRRFSFVISAGLRTFEPSDQARDSGFRLRNPRIYSPSKHRKALFLQGQENGKGGSLEIRARFYFSSTAPNLPKLQCYTNFVFSVIIEKTRNRINNFVQFYRQKGPKLVRR